MTRMQVVTVVDTWDVVDDDSGRIHHVKSTVDGGVISCDCKEAKEGEPCGAVQAIAAYIEAARDTTVRYVQ